MRTIDIFIRDRNSRPLEDAAIEFAVDGQPAGDVPYSEGRGRIENIDDTSVVDVTARYQGQPPQHAKLGKDQTAFTFTFDVAPAPPAPAPAPGQANPDLIDALLVLLIAGAADIFVFAMAARFISSPVFDKLPTFITDAYTAIWSSAIAGTAGIGGAIIKAFNRNPNVQAPNYLLYVLYTAFGLLVVILALAFVALRLAPPPPPGIKLSVPAGVHRINPKANLTNQSFDLEPPSGAPGRPRPASYVLKGTYNLKDGKITGRLDKATFTTTEQFAFGPMRIVRLEFSACYIHLFGNNEQFDSYPPPKSANAEDLDIVLEKNKKYEFPPMDFAFDLPPEADPDRIWLCAAIRQDEGGYFPAF